ncbi:thiamine phosphate synthase [Ureibacillus sp. FSL K6-8385]|uniref:thiamine phosphate synthase n=1 Tax=Ureibacillus TaxID=160795 RepID=UPI0015EFA49D|nr:thiamine phosphate synthase [Ureibacillus terrenus]MED3660854.1 thiamine phosphate synthase [Ureibacillus terrenus]MED3764648.1 thiamine phosphate synthase [Ureibacillus terrenus]
MNRKDLAVYFIMGTENCRGEEPLKVLEEALQAGITFFQLREKGERPLKGEELERFARECQSLCKRYHVPFIVNDDVELALKIDADGIHVGQDDTPIEEIRGRFQNKIIGVSVHNEEEMAKAVEGGADYVGIGPIYETKSKRDAKKPAGVTFLKKAREMYPGIPIVAIGGITPMNAREVIEAGADGVAVISAICESGNRQQTVRLLKGKQ